MRSRGGIEQLRERLALVVLGLIWLLVIGFGAGLLLLWWYFGLLRMG